MLTQEQIGRIKSVVWDHELGSGLGTRETACSIASINLALTGKLTDDIPECMSKVVGEWVKPIQDAMPPVMRNSPEWRDALILAAGTGRQKERERLAMIMDWLFETVLPILQPQADAGGYGPAWQKMCNEKTDVAAKAAWADAAKVAKLASRAAAKAADAAWEVAWEAWAAADAANAAWAAADAAWEAAEANFWQKTNPPALLARLIAV